VRLADGRRAEATVLAFDPQADLAALQVEVGDHDIQPIVPGDARTLLPGALVVAVGHPWGIDGAATSGAVIGLDEGFGDLRSPGREWLAVGARLRPGHSGGPMLDARGRLVGINTIMNGHGVGVAIPVHAVESFLERALVDVRVA
jgi:S1-C subfamily serine protease